MTGLTLAASPATDRHDFGSVVRDHGPPLLTHALKLTGAHADAWDLFQDTIERGMRSLNARVPGCMVRNWLFVVMKNLFRDRCRQAKACRKQAMTLRYQYSTVVVPDTEPSEPPWSGFDDQSVARCLDQLPAKMRRIFELHAGGFTYREIAACTNVPVNTVGTGLYRARRRIRAMLLATAGPSVSDEGDSSLVASRRRRTCEVGEDAAAPA